MLSIEKCKKVLIDDVETYTDEEVKMIREYLYKMAEISNQAIKKEKNGSNKE